MGRWLDIRVWAPADWQHWKDLVVCPSQNFSALSSLSQSTLYLQWLIPKDPAILFGKRKNEREI